jgi:hypothetical protein
VIHPFYSIQSLERKLELTGEFFAKAKRKLWTIALGEKSWIANHGDFRAREQYGLIPRANYLYGMLRAADVAKYFGKKRSRPLSSAWRAAAVFSI